MEKKATTLEHAFYVAASGQVAGIVELRKRLLRDGYDPYQIVGRGLMTQLQAIIRGARATGAVDAKLQISDVDRAGI